MADVKNTKYRLQGQCTYCQGPCKANAKRCMECRKKQIKQAIVEKRNEKERARQALLNRPCRHCGKPINTLDRRQVKCGLRCPVFTKVKVQCVICGRQVERYPSHLIDHNGACCSNKCQQIWAGRCGRGRVLTKDWQERSRKAKLIWRRAYSFKRRRRRSIDYQWWLLAKQEHLRVVAWPKSLDAWDRKCHTAIVGFRYRELRHKERKKRCSRESWSSSFAKAIPSLKSKIAARLKTGWDARCNSACSAIGKRMRS